MTLLKFHVHERGLAQCSVIGWQQDSSCGVQASLRCCFLGTTVYCLLMACSRGSLDMKCELVLNSTERCMLSLLWWPHRIGKDSQKQEV